MLFCFAWNSKCILPRISKLVLLIFFLRVSCHFLNTGFSCCQWIALICRWEVMRCSFLSAELCQEFRVRLWRIRKSGKENSWLDFPKQNLFPLSESKMPITILLWFGGMKVNEGKKHTVWWMFSLFYLWSNSWEINYYYSLSLCHIFLYYHGSGKVGPQRDSWGKNLPWSGL